MADDTIEKEFRRILGALRLVVYAGKELPDSQIMVMRGLFFSGVKLALISLAKTVPDKMPGDFDEERALATVSAFFGVLTTLQRELDAYDDDVVERVRAATGTPDKK